MKTVPNQVIGSWFSSGFYGHSRDKARNDFVCEYRKLAKPQPPPKFIFRSLEPAFKNVFSHHDNRHAFTNDALYFEQGLGRKRNPSAAATYNFKPDFITWMPEKEYTARCRPLTSTYRKNYTKAAENEPFKQALVKRPATSFDGVATTSYRYAHGDGQPNRTAINAMNNSALMLSTAMRKQRAKTAKPQCRETVASCLSWHVPHPPSRPVVPAATDTVPPTEDVSEPQNQETFDEQSHDCNTAE